MLKVKAGYTDEEIAGYIRQVDLIDGKLDGRANAPDEICSACGKRLLVHGHKKCLWCGAEVPEMKEMKSGVTIGESVAVL